MTADEADVAAMREQGDLIDYIKSLTGRVPKQRSTEPADETPCYHIRRPGAWPCGTAATGPSPGPSCPDCRDGRPR